jgi:short-subunit dehydrogenase
MTLNAIIIGATSGIGRELAKQMSAKGFTVGIAGRRTELLDSLENELSTPCYKYLMDLTQIEDACYIFNQLLKKMEDVDIVVINAGVGYLDEDFLLENELSTIDVNVKGFTALANIAFHYFAKRQKGHIVGLSSVAAIRGGRATAYNASKAYVSSYLEGLICQSRHRKLPIHVTDIRPGFVDTAMAQGEGIFWNAPVEKAAEQILNGIFKKHRLVYVTKRWRIIGYLLSILPFSVYKRIAG